MICANIFKTMYNIKIELVYFFKKEEMTDKSVQLFY